MEDYNVINLKTNKREELIDITARIQESVTSMGVLRGALLIFVPHTTAGLLINENADPDVLIDILGYLNKNVPRTSSYLHCEGNSDAHIKASLIGSSKNLLVSKGKIVLGTWQGIFFGEFDGPRSRKVIIGRAGF